MQAKFIFKIAEKSWLALNFVTGEWFVTPDPEMAFYTDADYATSFPQEWAEEKVGILFDCWEIQELTPQ